MAFYNQAQILVVLVHLELRSLYDFSNIKNLLLLTKSVATEQIQHQSGL